MPDHGYECPLCGLTSTETDEIYTHLMTSHRKSAVSTALLDATDARSESSESSSPAVRAGSGTEDLGRDSEGQEGQERPSEERLRR
ncbi:MAG: hypothetical protein ABEH78_01280 [Haloferacaceae archaeon]